MEKKKECLQTERLLLKALTESDEQPMLDIFFNEDIKATYMIPDFTHREQAEALFQKMLSFSLSELHFVYGIYFENTLIGFVNDCEINAATIELGYVISPKFQGKGFATEAVQACMDELFRMGFQRITAGFFQGNDASRRVMEKCGMHKIDLEDDIEYKGVLRHCLYYSIDRKGELA
jgi:RimJ/RimL family protein N-acetyltransferase